MLICVYSKNANQGSPSFVSQEAYGFTFDEDGRTDAMDFDSLTPNNVAILHLFSWLVGLVDEDNVLVTPGFQPVSLAELLNPNFFSLSPQQDILLGGRVQDIHQYVMNEIAIAFANEDVEVLTDWKTQMTVVSDSFLDSIAQIDDYLASLEPPEPPLPGMAKTKESHKNEPKTKKIIQDDSSTFA